MHIELDTHTHTVACNHAYSTVTEIAEEASRKGLKLVAITEHGPDLPGGPHRYFFSNIRVIPPEISGIMILRGIEANVTSIEGKIDLPERYEDRMDIVLAGLHEGVLAPGSKKDNTEAVINTMKNEIVDIVVHLGNPSYEIDFDDVVQAAKDTNTFIEINNSSFVHSRKGSEPNCREIAKKCMEMGVSVSLGSDAHFATDVGNFLNANNMLQDIGFPEELVVNSDYKKLLKYLRAKGREVLLDPRNI